MPKVKTYLSVDVDFFNGRSDEILEEYLKNLLKYSKDNDVPLVAVTNHQQLLGFVNKSEARKLVNIDEHSDLTDNSYHVLECGTWVSFVKWRKEGVYRWIYSGSYPSRGDCNGDYTIFHSERIIDRGASDWKELGVKTMEGKIPTFSNINGDVVDIGVCLSPSYACNPLHDVFYDWVEDNDILLIEGPKSEGYSRRVGKRRRK